MPLPDATVTITDGALKLAPDSADNVVALVGASSLGTPGQFYSFGTVDDIKATLGVGPLPSAAAYVLTEGGGPVFCVPATTAAGSMGSVTSTGTAPPVVTTTGTPLDQYDLRWKITAGGAVGTATFQYSVDGGDNYSADVTTASTYLIPGTGVTLNFPAGTYATDHAYAATATAPYYTTTNLGLAVDALTQDPREWGLLYPVGTPVDAAGSLAVASYVGAKLAAAGTNYRFVRGIVEAADVADSALVTAFASFADTRVAVAAGFGETIDPLTNRTMKRSIAWQAAARIARAPISEDLGRVLSGPLPSSLRSLYRDERKTPGLDAQRFITARTHLGMQGFYFTKGRLMAPAGSDFSLLQYGRVVDRAAKIARLAMVYWLNDGVRVDSATGYILEAEARIIESEVLGALRAGLVAPGHASDVQVTVNRTDNIISTQNLRAKVRVVPKGYASWVTIDLGFLNPATLLKAA